VRAEKAESHRDQLMRWIGDLGVRLGVLASENEPWKFATIARAAETLKRERDARPAITPEMARDVIESWDDSVAESGARDGTKSFTEWDVIMRALRSHAAKAVKT